MLDERTVAYLDLTRSGAETIAHLRENARITLMACALEGPPPIVRLYGTGEAVLLDDARFADLLARFPAVGGALSGGDRLGSVFDVVRVRCPPHARRG